jgi:hypothetical protein
MCNGGCRGMAMVGNGDIYAEDPHCWRGLSSCPSLTRSLTGASRATGPTRSQVAIRFRSRDANPDLHF